MRAAATASLGRVSRPSSFADPTSRAARHGAGLWRASAALLLIALLAGGGTRAGLPGDLIAQLAALPVLAAGLRALPWARLSGMQRTALVLAALLVLVAAAQLLPLPWALWRGLPGHADIAAALQAADAAPAALPLSLTPWATERMLWSLLPGLALFVAACGFERRELERLALLLLAVAALGVLWGFLQVAGGPASPLRFYRPTNPSEAVGFFANRNHYAALLVTAMPLAAAAFVRAWREQARQGARQVLFASLAAVAFALILLGLVIARSRAGLGLGMLALLACLPLSGASLGGWRSARGKALGLAGLVALLLGVQFGLYGVLQRLEQDPLSDARVQFAQVGLGLARGFLPWGSGLGSFTSLYEAAEPAAQRLAIVANHAHDDWLEWLIELGLPGIVLAALCAALVLYATARAWWRGGDRSDFPLRRAAGIGLVALLLHSLVDYPLRTTALMATAAVLLALLLRPAGAAEDAAPARSAVRRREAPSQRTR